MESNTGNWEGKLGPDCQALECQFLAVSCHKRRSPACLRSLEWCQSVDGSGLELGTWLLEHLVRLEASCKHSQ